MTYSLEDIRKYQQINQETMVPSFNCIVSAAAAKSRQLCQTLCDPIDGSPPGSVVPGILQARLLEWVAISFTRGSSQNIGVLPSASLLPMNIQD